MPHDFAIKLEKLSESIRVKQLHYAKKTHQSTPLRVPEYLFATLLNILNTRKRRS